MADDENSVILSKRHNLEKLREMGIEPYPYAFKPENTAKELNEKYTDKIEAGEHTEEKAKVAGRMMSRRDFGKLTFFVLKDETGTIQITVSASDTNEDSYKMMEYIDTGDWLGIEGNMMKTKKGQLSIMANKITLLSKSIYPMPEKWHGLSDVEQRYRKRHIDIAINDDARKILKTRSRIVTLMRKFLDDNRFVEVETPLMQPTYGGANARPFTTKSHALKEEWYLSIASELYLKRLIVGGIERVYTICKNFRNEDIDTTHNPEFTMMESYAAYWDYNDVMDFTEAMYKFIAKEIIGAKQLEFAGHKVDFYKPWRRLKMKDALKEYADINVDEKSDDELKKILKENKLEVEPYKRGLAIAELFEHFCEDKLIEPTFIIDHPKETTPLCKIKRGDEKEELIERFELYIAGWEMANAYSEQNDPDEQEATFREQADQGRAKGENHPIDEDFIDALKFGMPPTGGLGVGVDRLVMLFTNQTSIKEVILFPQMKRDRE